MASPAYSSRPQNHDRIQSGDSAMARAVDGGGSGGPGDEITASQKMLSAMSGSLVTSLLVTPLDVVRVRLQSQKPPTAPVDFSRLALTTNNLTRVQLGQLGVTACCREVFFAGNDSEFCFVATRTTSSNPQPMSPPDCVVQQVRQKTFSSTFDGMRKIARNEGITTLWRGLLPTLAMTIPANIIYFTGYDWLRHNHNSPLSKLSPDNAPLMAGSIARMLAATAVSPIELIRTRMQAASGTSTTNHLVEALNGIREMVHAHGYTSLWRGLTLTLWRDVPFSGLYWWGYETIRGRLADFRNRASSPSQLADESRHEARLRLQSRENHTDTFVDSFAAGAASGAFASIVTTPFDVGKTRTQVYRETPQGASSTGSVAPEERNIVRLLRHIFQTEGIRGLWKGCVPRTLKVAPACAIMISSYEVGKRAFRDVNQRSDTKHD
ncbi:hypothetical protein CDD81_367 [Ophiocordyceps australis]|uniref:Mitochondrial carrier protein n=1 Tax=Ophiocordyceps australis TaxID=1399860 RepID=A0A2C5X8M5_9HYPO|nr:hypothetical protein CDD81_367 [Ophiocordyceps australis]